MKVFVKVFKSTKEIILKNVGNKDDTILEIVFAKESLSTYGDRLGALDVAVESNIGKEIVRIDNFGFNSNETLVTSDTHTIRV